MRNSGRKANLPIFTHHDMRHYFCSNAIEAGIDFKVIAGWLGHKDGGILVAKTYGHLRDAHSFEMAKRMTFSVIPLVLTSAGFAASFHPPDAADLKRLRAGSGTGPRSEP